MAVTTPPATSPDTQALPAAVADRLRTLIIEGATTWPPELTGLHAQLSAAAADGGTEAELRDAYYRVEKRALESHMIAARAAGDDAEYLRLQAMVKRIEGVLRGAA